MIETARMSRAPQPLQSRRDPWSRPLRFVIVGIWNSLFGYAAFALFFWFTQSCQLHYLWAAFPAQVVAILNAYVWQRVVVFRATTAWMPGLVRFSGVYWAMFAANVLILWALVSRGGMHPLVAQALLVAGTAAISYVAHARFTFPQPPTPARTERE